jgi:hypothetical protein
MALTLASRRHKLRATTTPEGERVRIPVTIGIAAVVVAAIGATVMTRVIADATQPFVTAPPGSVPALCFASAMMDPCDPKAEAPITSRTITYHIQRTVSGDVHIAIASISGDREHQILVVDIGAGIFSGTGEEFSTFDCGACADTGSYHARAWAGSQLIGEGFFTMAVPAPPAPYFSPE